VDSDIVIVNSLGSSIAPWCILDTSIGPIPVYLLIYQGYTLWVIFIGDSSFVFASFEELVHCTQPLFVPLNFSPSNFFK
jgi:hypothetical protein